MSAQRRLLDTVEELLHTIWELPLLALDCCSIPARDWPSTATPCWPSAAALYQRVTTPRLLPPNCARLLLGCFSPTSRANKKSLSRQWNFRLFGDNMKLEN